MVLGLIEFLLGGKKKVKVPKSGQVSTPVSGVGINVGQAAQSQTGNVPDGAGYPTENVQNNQVQSQDNQNQQQVQQNSQNVGDNSGSQQFPSGQNGNKKSISEVIGKIHEELKSTNERISEMVSDIKTIENTVNTLGHRMDELEESKKVVDEKFSEIDQNMSKFVSLYELVNNQYNPFVEQLNITPQAQAEVKQVILGQDGNSLGDEQSQGSVADKNFKGIDLSKIANEAKDKNEYNAFVQLDTINIEEAAGDAVPLTRIKNNTNSLVIILSWLEYMIGKVGIDETRNSLRYYTEVLRWITPEVYFELDKYLRGMKDKKDVEEGASLNVKDHIVSLYFISKLNEKTLDDKLTNAVLQIIKN